MHIIDFVPYHVYMCMKGMVDFNDSLRMGSTSTCGRFCKVSVSQIISKNIILCNFYDHT